MELTAYQSSSQVRQTPDEDRKTRRQPAQKPWGTGIVMQLLPAAVQRSRDFTNSGSFIMQRNLRNDERSVLTGGCVEFHVTAVRPNFAFCSGMHEVDVMDLCCISVSQMRLIISEPRNGLGLGIIS